MAIRSETGAENVVLGKVADKLGRPLANLVVQAYDRDMRSEDLLGECVTDRDGRYRIAWSHEQLNGRGDGAPVVRVAFRPRYAGATGLSVYVPSPLQPSWQREKALAIYRNLLFPLATGWDRLLAWVYSEF